MKKDTLESIAEKLAEVRAEQKRQASDAMSEPRRLTEDELACLQAAYAGERIQKDGGDRLEWLEQEMKRLEVLHLADTQAIRAYQRQIEDAMVVLAPNVPSGLVDACKQVKQVAISGADNSERAMKKIDRLAARLREAERLLVGLELITADEMPQTALTSCQLSRIRAFLAEAKR